MVQAGLELTVLLLQSLQSPPSLSFWERISLQLCLVILLPLLWSPGSTVLLYSTLLHVGGVLEDAAWKGEKKGRFFVV